MGIWVSVAWGLAVWAVSEVSVDASANVCVCVRARGGGGKNNIKEGGPHGSMAPSGRLRRQLEKDKTYSPGELRRCLWCLLGSW